MAKKKKTLAGRLFRLAIFFAVLWAAGSAALSNASFKKHVEDVASRQLGQPVKIGGLLTPGMEGFQPAVVAHDVTIGKESEKTLHADSLQFAIPLAAAFRDRKVFAVGVGGLKVGKKEVGDYHVPVRLAPDGVEFPDIRGSLGGARLFGSASYRAKRLKVDLDVHDLDYETVAEGVRGGRLQGNIHLAAHGSSLPGLAATLGGSVSLIGGEGELEGGALDFWAGDLLSSILKGPEKETHLNCAVADFAITNGLARGKKVVIDTKNVTIYGTGTINFATENVDMRFSPKPKSPSLLSLATPVNVSGHFGDIHAHPDARGVAEKVGGLLLGTVATPAALLPFMTAGNDKNPCAKLQKDKP